MGSHNTGRLFQTFGLMKMQLTQILYGFFSLFIFGTRFLVRFRAVCDLCARTARSDILHIIL